MGLHAALAALRAWREGGGVLLELTREALTGEAADLVDEYAGMLGGGGWVVRVK